MANRNDDSWLEAEIQKELDAIEDVETDDTDPESILSLPDNIDIESASNQVTAYHSS